VHQSFTLDYQRVDCRLATLEKPHFIIPVTIWSQYLGNLSCFLTS